MWLLFCVVCSEWQLTPQWIAPRRPSFYFSPSLSVQWLKKCWKTFLSVNFTKQCDCIIVLCYVKLNLKWSFLDKVTRCTRKFLEVEGIHFKKLPEFTSETEPQRWKLISENWNMILESWKLILVSENVTLKAFKFPSSSLLWKIKLRADSPLCHRARSGTARLSHKDRSVSYHISIIKILR